jgi:hypothetical protein
MSPRFERFLARLYLDANAREQFLANPRAVAAAAGLADDEITAAVDIDRVGMELAAASFAHKRRHQQGRLHSAVRLWKRIAKGSKRRMAAAPYRAKQ